MQLPTQWQSILTPTSWPCNNGDSIASSLSNNTIIQLYLDSSVADGLGADAYTLRPACEQDNHATVGTAISPGDTETISSLQPEHYGGLCIAMWLWMLEQRFGLLPGTFHCHIDNITVVKRLTQGRPLMVVTTHSLVTDYDLWVETVEILENIQCKKRFIHVKGHQDDFIQKGNKQGPLNRHTYWNVQMDKIAENTQTQGQVLHTPFLASSKIALMVNGQAVTSNIPKIIRNAIVSKPLELYIREKERWSAETFSLVDWQAMGRAMKSISIHKQINAAKYMFDWQNTGAQKQRFERSLASQEDRPEEQVNLYPLNCGCTETAQHFLQCRILRDARILDQCYTSVNRWFAKHWTHPVLQKILMTAIRAWIDETEIETSFDTLPELQEWGIQDALTEQTQIGWNNFFKGCITKAFGNIQMKAYHADPHITQVPSHYSAIWWTSRLIKEMIYLSLNVWQHRNRHLHNSQTAASELLERTDALKRKGIWYEMKHMFPLDDPIHFHQSYLERCMDTTKQIRLWLQKITDLYKYNKQRTLQAFLYNHSSYELQCH